MTKGNKMKLKDALKEVKTNIKMFDGSNSDSTTAEMMGAFDMNGFRGIFDPDTGEGAIKLGNSIVKIKTQEGSLLLSMEDLELGRDYVKAIKKLKEFLEFTV